MENKRIIIASDDGSVEILIPAICGLSIEDIVKKDVPEGKKHRIVEIKSLPDDRTFRAAWTDDNKTDTVDVDMLKAKTIAHNIRRQMRDKEMAPLDIKSTIPQAASKAESDRVILRKKYTTMQVNIDKASTPEKLKTILGI